ncbi:MAG: branched-chain amino acid ABC transporter permease [Eubacteriales bacterium]
MDKKNKKYYLINTALILLVYVVIQLLLSKGVLSRFYSTIIILICINIIMATSLNLSVGFMGQLVLGHAGFMAIGAYTAGLLGVALNTTGMPGFIILIICLLAGGLLASIAGIIIGIPALRLRGDYLGIMTLGFAEIVRITITNLTGLTKGAQGLTRIPTIANFTNVYFIMVLCVVVIMMLSRSRHGRAIISIKENEIAAESVGIDTTFYKVSGFAISAFIGGIGGGLFAFTYGYISPKNFTFMKSVDILVIACLGGLGSITGSILAAIVFTILPELLRDFDEYRMIAYSLALILMMLFRPQGLFGTSELSTAKIGAFLKRVFMKKEKITEKGGKA